MMIQGEWVVSLAVFFEISKISSSYSVLECRYFDGVGILLVGSCFGVGVACPPWNHVTVRLSSQLCY